MHPIGNGEKLAILERYREWYLEWRDPIPEDRLLWRAQMFRHLVHLLPGQSILELGCGQGRFTRQLGAVSRTENPITAISFLGSEWPPRLPSTARFLHASSLPGSLDGERFDTIVANDLLDESSCPAVLQEVYKLLNPGGQVVFFQSNPWNAMLKLRRVLSSFTTHRDPRSLISRRQLYELLSEVGFIRVFSVYNDFVYAPLTPRLAWLLRNLSVVLENMPGFQTLAGSILLHAQRPPRALVCPRPSLFIHEKLRDAVSIVVPCHNEEMNIGPLIMRLRDLFDEYIHEIIPVDDNSTDRTWDRITELAQIDQRIRPIKRRPPCGVGRALSDGFRVASGRYVLSMDCDFQHLLPEVRDLFDAAAAGHEVVIGSRFSRYSVLLNYPFQKIIANRAFHLFAKLVLPGTFRDVTNNLKLIRRDVLARMRLLEPGFAVNAEVGLQPFLLGCDVQEVPISWINRAPDMGTSSFRLARVGWGYWRVLARLWLKVNWGKGPYAPAHGHDKPADVTPTPSQSRTA
jgi:dolichol-phosphate mannosyltransferase